MFGFSLIKCLVSQNVNSVRYGNPQNLSRLFSFFARSKKTDSDAIIVKFIKLFNQLKHPEK